MGLNAQGIDSSQTNWSMPGINTPDNINTIYTFDPITGFYIGQRYIGNVPMGSPIYLSKEDYSKMIFSQQETDGWKSRWSQGSSADKREGSSIVPDMNLSNNLIEDIFGSDELEIRPQGTAELRFGLRFQHIKNPIVPERNRKNLAFDFEQKMQVNETVKLG
jgi:cell surface protein SprA